MVVLACRRCLQPHSSSFNFSIRYLVKCLRNSQTSSTILRKISFFSLKANCRNIGNQKEQSHKQRSTIQSRSKKKKRIKKKTCSRWSLSLQKKKQQAPAPRSIPKLHSISSAYLHSPLPNLMGCPNRNRIKTICGIPSSQGRALKRELKRRRIEVEGQRGEMIKRRTFTKSKATISERERGKGTKRKDTFFFGRRKRDLAHSPLDRPLPLSSHCERAKERKTLVLAFTRFPIPNTFIEPIGILAMDSIKENP